MANTTLARWHAEATTFATTFARQTLSMTWDFAETNPFAMLAGDIMGIVDGIASVIEKVLSHSSWECNQKNAMQAKFNQEHDNINRSPYYDNVAYADLVRFFLCMVAVKT